ncbi:MAG: glycosyltransferase [Verrucomicrobiales bacterium]
MMKERKEGRKFLKKRAPRIAMVSTHGYVAASAPLGAPDTGGQVVFVLELSKKLAQLGYQVDIWTRQFEDQAAIEPVDDGVQIIRMPCGGKEFIPKEYLYKKLPEWGENALRFIQEKGYQYQFINSHYWDAGLASQHLAEVLDVPHIHTPHSIGSWKLEQMSQDSDRSTEELERQFNFSRRIHHETNLYRECQMVVATSPPQYDRILKQYEVPKAKVKMIPPGYDDNRFFPMSEASRQALRQQHGYEGAVIASIGRLARNKGFDLLVDAFAVTHARENLARLRIACGVESSDPGDNEIFAEMQAKVKQHGIEDVVKFAPSLADEEMADFYRMADVFALSSRYEPFGMTAIEAMACGTPTVVTTHGGLYRAMDFGQHALYADTLDAQEFGVTLLQVLKYPRLRQRLAREGAHRVRSLFTWTGIAQQLLSAVEARTSPTFQLSGIEDAYG